MLMPKNEGCSIKRPSFFDELFVFSVIPSIGRPAAVEGRRFRLRGRRRRPPLPLLVLFPGSGTDLDQHHVHADLGDVFQIDEKVSFPPPKSSASGRHNALHFALGVTEHHVAHFTEPFSVAKIDDFFLL